MSRNVAARMTRNKARRGREPHPSESTALYTSAGARKYLNAEERGRFLAYVEKSPPDVALFAQLLFWTGARVSELLELSFSRFQPAAGIVAIRTLKRRCFSMREIPIPPGVMIAVTRLAGDVASPRTPLWRFHRSTAWREISHVMKSAGISGPQACPRGLRHGFAIAALQSGVPLTLLQRWMGHNRLSTTAIYLEVSGQDARKFAARMWKSTARAA